MRRGRAGLVSVALVALVLAHQKQQRHQQQPGGGGGGRRWRGGASPCPSGHIGQAVATSGKGGAAGCGLLLKSDQGGAAALGWWRRVGREAGPAQAGVCGLRVIGQQPSQVVHQGDMCGPLYAVRRVRRDDVQVQPAPGPALELPAGRRAPEQRRCHAGGGAAGVGVV